MKSGIYNLLTKRFPIRNIKLNYSVANIVEVGPRDGLQYEKTILPCEVKIELINRLSHTGLTRIECGSFVNPRLVPQMRDSESVISGIDRTHSVSYSALVPNQAGALKAIQLGVLDIAFFTAASDSFCQKNINCTVDESFLRLEEIFQVAKSSSSNLAVRGYLSCIVDCPYSGSVDPQLVATTTARLLRMGCYEVSLGDTTGKGTPDSVRKVLEAVQKQCPTGLSQVALHCHNTNGRALANIAVGLDMGVTVIDASIGGLGGCPFAGDGASGNVATEQVVALLAQRGQLATSLQTDRITETADWIRTILDTYKKK